MERNCVQCGKRFTLSEYEIEFYNSRNLSIPKRCKQCRDLNKKLGTNATDPKLWRYKDSKDYQINGYSVIAIIMTLLMIVICFFFACLTIIYNKQFPIIEFTVTSLIFLLIISITLLVGKNNSTKQESHVIEHEYKATFYDTESMREHYIKHGQETHSNSVEEYLRKANNVITDKHCSITVDEDGDKQYYNPRTKEFVVIAKAGYIRTYYVKSNKHY